MDKKSLEDLAIRFTDAFNRDDLDAVMSHFAEDAVYDEFHGARHEGREAIRAAFEPQFKGAYGSVRFDQEDLFADAEAGKVLISWTCTMTTRKGPGGWRGLDILHFADGRLVEKQTYAKAKVPLLKPVAWDEDANLFFSAASRREVAFKNGFGRRDFSVDPRVLRRGLLEYGYVEMAVTGAHAAAVDLLPPIHKGPFDRLLIAQARVEGLTLLTADRIVACYSGPIRAL